MKTTVTRSELPQWKDLAEHHENIKDVQIKDLFEKDPERFNDFHLKHEQIMLDYSKQQITKDTLDKLMELAKACDLEGWRDKMFSGEAINITENRSVLHSALRTKDSTPIMVDGQDIIPEIQSTLDRLKNFSDKIRKEKKFTHIVNIGVGGSDLAPAMVFDALKYYSDREIRIHFVSNIDGTDLTGILKLIEPEKTLFIVTSKTFTTQETIANARSAKIWMQDKLNTQDVSKHFIAVSQNTSLAKEFVSDDEHVFPIWDWVGGRFSLWSAVGLSFCISIGFDNFQELLDGAYSMDQHFINAPLDQNMPVLLAMIGIWHRNFFNLPAISITPYDQYLWRFPSYIKQLDMESNGKSIDRDNNVVKYETGAAVVSEVGTNAQHSYFQIIHQGTTVMPCDFIMMAKSQNPIDGHHEKLLANAIAQSKALMDGRKHKNPHKAFDGNRPSNTIILDRLTPYNLGMLIALYEHKIFVQGIIWNINSFDQCGVELGKDMANNIVNKLGGKPKDNNSDSSTNGILDHIKNI